jgi:hypothetical protein
MFVINIHVVSAAWIDSVDSFVTDYVNPVLKYLIGDVTSSYGADAGAYLLVKLLFLIIILSLVYYSVKQIPNIGENAGLKWLISIVVSILAIRYISSKQVLEFMWFPTGAMGIVLVTLIPFIIFFFFIESFNSTGSFVIRRVGWVTFAVVYIMLANMRWAALAVRGEPLFGFINNLGWFYLIIAILSFIVMLFDPKVRVWFLRAKSATARRAVIEVEISKHQQKIDELQIALRGAEVDSGSYKSLERQIKEQEKHIYKLQKESAKLS